MVSLLPAIIKMEPRTKPIQGIQPAPNKKPIINELEKLAVFRGLIGSFFSVKSERNEIMPAICKPNNTIKIPPSCSIRVRFVEKSCPRNEDDAPIKTKIIVKPRMNPTLLVKIKCLSACTWPFDMEAPVN